MEKGLGVENIRKMLYLLAVSKPGLTILVVFLLSPAVGWCFQEWKKWRIRRWPIVQGVITKTDVELAKHADSSQEGDAWTPIVWYSYEVNGIGYQGRSEMEPWYLDIRSALAAADDLIGKNLQVRYRSENPANSTWLEADGGSGQLAPAAKPHPVSGLVTLSLK